MLENYNRVSIDNVLNRTELYNFRLNQHILELQKASNVEAIWQVMESLASSVEFEYLSYVSMRSNHKNCESITISNLPKWWQDLYLTDHLICEDIISKYCTNLRPKLINLEYLDELQLYDEVTQERMMAMKEAGIKNGFVCPTGIAEMGGISGWCFGSSLTQADFVRAYANFGSTLRLAAICAHERVENLVHTKIHQPVVTDGLSAREQECLAYLASGKRSSNIAKIMGISLSTVDFHITGIKKKLKATTREEAVAKAITFGHISYSA